MGQPVRGDVHDVGYALCTVSISVQTAFSPPFHGWL
jgi:hypothetical protein